jgi:ERCC4-type nuclease
MITIVADDRERLVIPYLHEHIRNVGKNDMELKVARIQIGDYAIYKNDQILFSIERKSLVDLSASINDAWDVELIL